MSYSDYLWTVARALRERDDRSAVAVAIRLVATSRPSSSGP